MFITIIMTRHNGFVTDCYPRYEPALDRCVAATMLNAETTAVIYNGAGQLIWRMFGKVEAPKPAPAPVAINDEIPEVFGAPRYRIHLHMGSTFVCQGADLRKTIQLATALAVKNSTDYYVVSTAGGEDRTIFSTIVRIGIDELGTYYAPDGTLMNANGSRSIFDDVDLAGGKGDE